MKHVLLFLCITVLFVRCDVISDPLPGLYVTSATHDFGTVQDSLVVRPSDGNDKYVISRTTLIDYTRKEERQPQFKTDEWIALYDNKTKSLSIPHNGKILHFDEEKNSLVMGKTLFKKVEHAKNVDDLVSRNY